MTPEQHKRKWIIFLLTVAYFAAGYFFCGHINMARAHYYDVSFAFENQIPFMPFFITGYTSVYIALFLVFAVIDDYLVFKKAMVFFILISTFHFIIFLMFPVHIVRPNISDHDGIMAVVTRYYYLIDYPVNCFPSLHVAYPMTGTILLWNYKRKWGYILAAFTLFIAVSVVLVKQHYVLDVAGGLITPFIVYAALKRCAKL